MDHPKASVPGHKFSGYYFTYPSDAGHRGLVSTIAEDPPMLNWIFVEKDSGEVRHGGRKETLEHKIGPWGWSDDEKWLTLEGVTTGFIAVEDAESKKWTVSLDRDRSGVESVLGRPADPDEDGMCQRWAPIRLRRKMALGMDSTWVKDSERGDRG
jgi:hypothetical protein